MDYEAQTVNVEENITYTNQTGEDLPNLVLAVEPNLWLGCFEMQSLTSDQVVAGTHLTSQKLTLTLASPLPPDSIFHLTARYRLNLPRTAWGNEEATRNLIFGYTGKQENLVNWYLFLVPYVPGEGWLLHEPGDKGEHLVYDSADYDVTLHFPGETTKPVVAAPTEGKKIPDGWWYHLEDARTFTLSLSPDFQQLSTSVGEITVLSYFFGDDSQGGELVLQNAAKAVEIYGEKFAPYPHPTLTLVQGDFIPSMEFDGMVFIGHMFYHYLQDPPRNYLVVMTAHEVAHQWWFALVGNDQAMEPWLDEGMATFSERIFYETAYPEDAKWWQDMRITRYEPLSGWVDMTIYEPTPSYLQAVYLRGAKFMEDLRNRMGDEAFFAFLKDYATSYSHQRGTTEDFFQVLSRHTQKDISDIIALYFHNHP